MSTFAFAARAAAARIDSRTWFTLSGERVTGEDVAAHIESASLLMRRDNWDPQRYGPGSGRHLLGALREARLDSLHDEDTQAVARDVMEQILEVHLAAPYVDLDVWSEKASRSLPEVLDLLAAAATFARTYGPRMALAA
jgi:hypothetical protein